MKYKEPQPKALKIAEKLVNARKDMGKQIHEALVHKEIHVPKPLQRS